MKPSLTLRCLDDRRVLAIENISALTASDTSGQFGILPGHVPLLTLLLPGMVTIQMVTNNNQTTQQFLATAGGSLIFRDGVINIISTRFVLAQDIHALMPALQAIKAEESAVRQGEHQCHVDLTRTLAKRMKEWQELK